MKSLVLVLTLAACVSGEDAHSRRSPDSSASTFGSGDKSAYSYSEPPLRPSVSFSDASLRPSYPESPAAAAAAPRPASAPASSYGGPQPATSQPSASLDQQGYYYYYYPVQEEDKKGVFDFQEDSDLLLLVTVGVVVVGALLVAVSYFDTTYARTLDPIRVSYDDMYDVAKKVFRALNKKY
ncbi:uncharacterized protein [Procambarus clarkii]|uniref:uncharacterized protein n=1 Tax=Procambarus clarkii TaxID=6728 RepID=UPI003742A727